MRQEGHSLEEQDNSSAQDAMSMQRGAFSSQQSIQESWWLSQGGDAWSGGLMKNDKSAFYSSIHQISLQHLLNTWHLTSFWGNISKQEQIEQDQPRHASKQTNEKESPLNSNMNLALNTLFSTNRGGGWESTCHFKVAMSLGSEQSLVGTLSFFGATGWPFRAFLLFLFLSCCEASGNRWNWVNLLELGGCGGWRSEFDPRDILLCWHLLTSACLASSWELTSVIPSSTLYTVGSIWSWHRVYEMIMA